MEAVLQICESIILIQSAMSIVKLPKRSRAVWWLRALAWRVAGTPHSGLRGGRRRGGPSPGPGPGCPRWGGGPRLGSRGRGQGPECARSASPSGGGAEHPSRPSGPDGDRGQRLPGGRPDSGTRRYGPYGSRSRLTAWSSAGSRRSADSSRRPWAPGPVDPTRVDRGAAGLGCGAGSGGGGFGWPDGVPGVLRRDGTPGIPVALLWRVLGGHPSALVWRMPQVVERVESEPGRLVIHTRPRGAGRASPG